MKQICKLLVILLMVLLFAGCGVKDSQPDATQIPTEAEESIPVEETQVPETEPPYSLIEIIPLTHNPDRIPTKTEQNEYTQTYADGTLIRTVLETVYDQKDLSMEETFYNYDPDGVLVDSLKRKLDTHGRMRDREVLQYTPDGNVFHETYSTYTPDGKTLQERDISYDSTSGEFYYHMVVQNTYDNSGNLAEQWYNYFRASGAFMSSTFRKYAPDGTVLELQDIHTYEDGSLSSDFYEKRTESGQLLESYRLQKYENGNAKLFDKKK